jgi:hypothetical protein
MTERVSRARRIVDRLTGASQLERMQALERTVRKLAEAQRDQSGAVERKLAELAERLALQPSAKDLQEVLQAIRALAGQIDRNVEDQLARGGVVERQRLDEKRLFKRLDQMAAGNGPIIVGPWSGEVGFELLYWIPFVDWVRHRWGLDNGRQIVVSRGGVGSWYGSTAGYRDIFSIVSPDEFRSATEQEERKQRRLAAFDRRIIDAVVAGEGLHDIDLLHPGLMYRMFMPFWRDDSGFATVERFSRYRRLEPPADAMPPGLPSEYVAVRFYSSGCFPDTPANRAFVRSVLAALTARTHVVLLDPGIAVDDHRDYSAEAGARLHTIAEGLSPERNLAVQSAVIGRARAFVGTYGGYSYLAPFYGVPAIAFYSVPSFKLQHLHVAQRVCERLGVAHVMPIDVAQAAAVQLAIGALAPVTS